MEYIVIFLPLLGAFLSGFFGKIIGSRNSEILTSLFVSISAILSFLVGYSSNMSISLIIFLILVYGCFVTGESASITSGVIESAEKENRGATMAVHSSIGFIGSFLGPIGFGIVLNEFGGHNSSEAWFWAFSSTGIILMLGPLLFLLLTLKKT